MLRQVGGVLAGACRATDVAARIGGDEFIVLVTGIDATSALRLGEHLLHDVSQPITLADGTRVSVGLSIGISIVSGANRSPQAALDSADAALYRAKARGGRCCAVAGGGEPVAADGGVLPDGARAVA